MFVPAKLIMQVLLVKLTCLFDLNPLKCGLYGYPKKLDNGSCSTSSCYCLNYFTGKKCNECRLQCANKGTPSRDCAACLCPKGFTGLQCHCRGEKGSVLLNGQNDVLIAYRDQPQPSPQLQYSYNLIHSLLTTMSSTNLQLDQISVQLNLTVIDGSTPSALKPTLFLYDITYGCGSHNPSLSESDIISRWANFTQHFASDPTILSLFTFPLDASNPSTPTIIPSGLEPIPPTLDPTSPAAAFFPISPAFLSLLITISIISVVSDYTF